LSKKHAEWTRKFTVSHDQALRAGEEWSSLLQHRLAAAIEDPAQHRDVGKMLAYAAEDYVLDWLARKTDRQFKRVFGQPYDGITDDAFRAVRFQIKFRTSDWHLETTRRNSAKNADRVATGHVAYAAHEFDVLIIFIPGHAFALESSAIRLSRARVNLASKPE
jgi:hypothetical protein